MKKVLILFFAILLFSCVKLTSGVVIEKGYTPGWWQTNVVYAGKTPIITNTYYPEVWSIKVRGVYKGKPREEWWTVSQTFHDSININDSIRNR